VGYLKQFKYGYSVCAGMTMRFIEEM